MRGFYFAFSVLAFLCFIPENALSMGENSVPINMALNIPRENTIHVAIRADSSVPKENVNAVIDSLMSERYLIQGGRVYFNGWEGTLIHAAQLHGSYTIPLKIQIVNSYYEQPNVVITLTSSQSDVGYSGLTTFVADNNMIKNSHITIYQANDLSIAQTGAVARHEFGHALGLGHSTISSDLMYPIFTVDSAFISELDEQAIEYLYS